MIDCVGLRVFGSRKAWRGHVYWPRTVWLGLLVFALASTEGHTEGASAAGTLRQYHFAVISEMPFGLVEQGQMIDLLRAADGAGEQFVVHLGNLKSRAEACDDDLLGARRLALDSSPRPLIVLPGANEWVGCQEETSPEFDPRERLSSLRDLLYTSDLSLGQDPMPLARESSIARFRGFPENVRWQLGPVVFVGLNVAGGNNDFRFAGGRNGEFEDRVVADRFWLERAFRIAKAEHALGIVVAIQGDPEFGRPLRAPDRRSSRRDGFYEFKLVLRDLTSQFHGQVLLVHGGSGGFRVDQPMQDALGHPLRNFTRIGTLAAGHATQWVRIDVDIQSPRVFSARPFTAPVPPVPPAAPSAP